MVVLEMKVLATIVSTSSFVVAFSLNHTIRTGMACGMRYEWLANLQWSCIVDLIMISCIVSKKNKTKDMKLLTINKSSLGSTHSVFFGHHVAITPFW